MKTYTVGIIVSAAATLLGAACRSDSTSTSFDAPTQGGVDAPPGTPDGPSGDGPAAGNGCNGTYTASSIASMRQGTASACFELDNVVSLAVTPSSKSPVLYVQDSAGGTFSGLATICESTSTTHPCTVVATVSALAAAHSVTIKGLYEKSKTTGYESFYIDSITDNGAGTIPKPGTATLTDISRSSTNKGLAFQIVTAPIASGDPLVMYDWTPAEFVYTGATKCPYQFGFGMIPTSAKATAAAACSGTTSQPAGQASPNASEILIGTDFFDDFTFSSDCQCAATYKDTLVTSTDQLTGTITGILVFDVPFGSSAGYYYIAPLTNTDAMLVAK